MAGVKVPNPPAGTKASGRRLWRSVLVEYDCEEHELALLREMVRTVDKLDELAAVVDRDGVMVPGPGLTTRVHPALVEARQLRIAFARLAAALRLPSGDEGDPAANRRPQRRSGVRGPYRFGVVS
jgi:hypothetical protein